MNVESLLRLKKSASSVSQHIQNLYFVLYLLSLHIFLIKDFVKILQNIHLLFLIHAWTTIQNYQFANSIIKFYPNLMIPFYLSFIICMYPLLIISPLASLQLNQSSSKSKNIQIPCFLLLCIVAVLGVFCLKWHKYLVVNDDIIEHFSRRQNIGKQENRQISS